MNQYCWTEKNNSNDVVMISMHATATTPSNIETPILSNHNVKTTNKSSNRLSSFDIFRGLIMIIMLIDHFESLTTKQMNEAWYGMHPGYYITFKGNLPLALYKFWWRWLSGICAPGFFLLMGFGLIHYYHHRLDKLKWHKLTILKYLFLRGLLLMCLGWIRRFLRFYPWRCNFSSQYPCHGLEESLIIGD
eukprot:310272_1